MSQQNTAASNHLVCPHCLATNRIDPAKASLNTNAQPNCGKCHQVLLTASPIVLNPQSLTKIVQKNDILTVIDFWASWCQPCLMMAPQFASAAQSLPHIVFAKFQTDQYEQAAAAYNIRSLPTMVAFRHGREIARQSGALPSAQIMQWVSSLR